MKFREVHLLQYFLFKLNVRKLFSVIVRIVLVLKVTKLVLLIVPGCILFLNARVQRIKK